MRSGTSRVEQIISSHPAAAGAGELSFWSDVAREHEEDLRQQLLPESVRRKLGERYLKLIDSYSATARRVVDKAPINSDFLGLIYSVLPNARIIYLQRDPKDACLSSYFQQLSPSLSYATDLDDLAHYYRQHARLMAHWRQVLPAHQLLEVPYAGLVEDQQTWTRKILDFVGLAWSHECINFHETSRFVMTASNWQVRQKLYRGSVERWRNYEPFIGPLLQL